MTTLFILILIPIFCVVLSLYMMSLITFVINNDLDVLMVCISIFSSILSLFMILKLLINEKDQNAFILNLENKFNIIMGFYSYILLFLLGVTSIINSFINGINYFFFGMGILLIILFIYVIIEYILKKENLVFKLENIEKINKKTNLLSFSQSNKIYELYINSNIKVKKNASYLCTFNKSTNSIIKIQKEVIDIENYKK